MLKISRLALAAALPICLLVNACHKKSKPESIYMQARINNSPFNAKFCGVFTVGTCLIVEGFDYTTDNNHPLYPKIQLWMGHCRYKVPDSYTISPGDSIMALVCRSETDTVKAVSGTINLTSGDGFMGYKGFFDIVLSDGTHITNGSFFSGPLYGLI